MKNINKYLNEGVGYEYGNPPNIQEGTKEYEVQEAINKMVSKYHDKNRSRMSFNKIVELTENENYFVAQIYGGLNGPGKWQTYLEDITNLMKDIEKEYHTWIVQLINDCLDDVYTLEIGVAWKDSDNKIEDK